VATSSTVVDLDAFKATKGHSLAVMAQDRAHAKTIEAAHHALRERKTAIGIKPEDDDYESMLKYMVSKEMMVEGGFI
jgi:hypothetical protein